MNPTPYSYAFFSLQSAQNFGFSLCPLAEQPDDFVQVTHVSHTGPLEEWNQIKDMSYVGIIETRRFGGNHYHIPQRDSCTACIGSKMMEQGGNRRIVKAKRK